MALEEARELRPEAPELADAEQRVALLPFAIPVVASPTFFRSRTFGAIALLCVGVTLLTALDFVRSGAPTDTAAAITAPPVLTPAVTLRTVSTDDVPAFDLDAPPVEPEEEPLVVTVPAADEPEPQRAVGTTGVPDRVVPAPAPAPAPEPITEPDIQRAALVEVVDEPLPRVEIPDDFLALPAPQPRREAIVASPVVSPSSGGPLLIRPPAVSADAAVNRDNAVAPARRDETLVSSVLDRYARAYDALDASAAREVWPSVDERALAKAFAGLESQHVAFDDCNIDVQGEIANASCRGLASYVGKIGNRQPRTEPRQWTFELRREGEAWRIESAEATSAQ